jgi:short-subunit dehydrogenase
MPSPIMATNKSTNFKNVGVIGGSRGLGLQLKTLLESQEINVKSFSRREGQDINEPEGRKSIIEWLSNLEGKAHLVFTVGSIQQDSILNLNEESLISQFKTNLISIIVCISEALQVAQTKIESIVLIGSTAGIEGRENLISYSSSKAGLVAFMQATSDELMALGIRINIVVPERIRSELRREKFLEEDSSYLEELDVVEVILECLTKLHHGNVFSVRKI